MNGEKLLKMGMSRLKIKLSFSFSLLFLFCQIFPQAIFLSEKSDVSFSLSSSYLKQKIPSLYSCNFDFKTIIKNRYEIVIGYSDIKEKPSIINDYHRSNEFILYELKYFIHGHKIKYSVSLKAQKGISDNVINSINYCKLMIGKEFKGSYKSGMNYYPYIEYEYPLKSNFNNNIDNNSSLFKSIYIGCFITYKKLWFEPMFKLSSDNQVKYNGIKIGIWDVYRKKNKKSIRLK